MPHGSIEGLPAMVPSVAVLNLAVVYPTPSRLLQLAPLERLSGQNGSSGVAYEILRRNNTGVFSTFDASESTPVLPSDVVQVEPAAQLH